MRHFFTYFSELRIEALQLAVGPSNHHVISRRQNAATMNAISNLANSAGILEQSMGAGNRVGIGLSFSPGSASLESIPGLLKRLKIPSLFS